MHVFADILKEQFSTRETTFVIFLDNIINSGKK